MEHYKISAKTFDGKSWGGWGKLFSLQEAVFKVKGDPEIGHIIIDGYNLKIWVSDLIFSDHAIKSAKANFDVDIPQSNVFLGFPNVGDYTN